MSMRNAALTYSDQGPQLYLVPPVLTLLFLAFFIVDTAQAQAPLPPITSSGLNTVVTTNGNVHDITGGTRPSGGANLFHSFGEFGVPTNNIANFLNETGLPTSNILGRVTGGNISNIFGTIQTTGFGNANLFLMNPVGFLFGTNATVNVGGMVAFTTADYLKLADDVRFNAIPDAAADALLTASPVTAFGFLGSNPAAIAVQGSQLTVAKGTGLSLIGGNRGFTYTDPDTGTTASVPDGMTITEARLSALSGQINIASVASAGEILLAGLQSAPNINGQSFTTMGNITLSQGATLDVSENAGGTVRIRGGQLVMDQTTISADTVNANGALVAIDINVTGDLAIANVDVPAVTARTTGSGDAGEIQVSSANMNIMATGVNNIFVSAIDTHTSGSGKAGEVNIATGDLMVTGDPSGASFVFFVDSGTSGLNTGPGGDVTINANQIQAQDITLASSGNFVAFLNGVEGAGTAGDVTINAESVNLFLANIVTDSFDFVSGSGKAGSLTVTSRDITLESGSFSSAGQERGGAITVNTDTLRAIDGDIVTQTNLLNGGPVNITGKVIELTTSSTIVSSTGGNGHAGSITIKATDHLTLLAEPVTNDPSTTFNNPSGIFSNSFGTAGGTLGNAGDILITTPRLVMTNGSRIDTTTATSGRGGKVTIQTTDSISMSGETGAFAPDSLFTLGALQPSGIYTRTIGGKCSGPCGDAGNISINTGSISMGTGSQINSGTSSSGQGGTISITASDTIAMSGTLSTDQAGGIQSRTIGTDPDAGAGGNIALTAGQSITISDGASVSSSSTGPGNTGNIQINAGNQFEMTNSTVTTEATQAGGGTIKITTSPSGTVQLTNSMISASVLDGTGGGGSVNIDPQFVILQNSQILAQAVQGPGGNISITTNLLLPDANSVISASSQFGVNGTVTIQSPNAPGSGQVQPLGKTPLQATSLLNQHCAALAGGEFSSFTVAGRDSLPTEPGSWLTSPLATLNAGMRLGVKAEGVRPVVWDEEPEGETALLSLRQIAPPGFLTQTFAVDWSAGCQS